MKTPITYYGGKQQLAKRIIALFPEHNLYCEPFIGGGAVFFAKEPSPVEVINDTNREIINFYRVVQNNFRQLKKEIQATIHSRDLHRKAKVIYANPDMFGEVQRAWAFWTIASQSYASKMDGPWGYERKSNSIPKRVKNKQSSFTEQYVTRLQDVQLECTDALRIIRTRDSKGSFYYCDPPYFNSNMGHYDGYTEEDFELLLKLLGKIKGKFLLSAYPSDILKKHTKKNGWHKIEFDVRKSITAHYDGTQRKREVLTANYPLQPAE